MNSVTTSMNALIMGRAAPSMASTANMAAAFSAVYTPKIPEGLSFAGANGEMISLEAMVAAEMLTHANSGVLDAMNNLTSSASLTASLLDAVGSAVDMSV